MKRLTVIDLFAGAGGAAVGFRQADPNGFHVCYEHNADAVATLETNGHYAIRADLSDPGHLARFQAVGVGATLHLHASPPCQTFSAAGKGEGRKHLDSLAVCVRDILSGGDVATDIYESIPEGSRLSLVPAYWIAVLQPDTVSFEQVRGVLPLWEVYADVLENLYGYETWTGVLHSEQYGVPQTRTRAWLMASADRPVQPPAPTHSRYYSRNPEKLDDGLLPWVSMADALGVGGRVGFPRKNDLDDGHEYRVRDTPDAETRPALTVTEKARSWTHIMQGGVSDGTHRDWTHLRSPQSVAGGPRASRDADEPSVTVTTGFGRARLETISRRITTEEAAALQGFPPGYKFDGTRTSQFRQIGNAVPPAVAAAVLNTLIGDQS